MIRMGIPVRSGRAPGEISQLLYEPRGVGLVISPWNFPFSQSVGTIGAGLVTGNTIVYKPSSYTPVIGHIIFDIFKDCVRPFCD